MNKKKITTQMIVMIAMGVVINYIGGQLALMLRLPIYLDSIGTILVAYMFGPIAGMCPPLISGLLMAATGDIFSLYFAPVGIILGLTSGLVLRKMFDGKKNVGKSLLNIILAAFVITVPSTIVSSIINAVLFGGITSSGSTVLVQLLRNTPLGLTGSVFVVQILTDFLDRIISLALVLAICSVPYIRQMIADARRKATA